jgi:hypothetical protein
MGGRFELIRTGGKSKIFLRIYTGCAPAVSVRVDGDGSTQNVSARGISMIYCKNLRMGNKIKTPSSPFAYLQSTALTIRCLVPTIMTPSLPWLCEISRDRGINQMQLCSCWPHSAIPQFHFLTVEGKLTLRRKYSSHICVHLAIKSTNVAKCMLIFYALSEALSLFWILSSGRYRMHVTCPIQQYVNCLKHNGGYVYQPHAWTLKINSLLYLCLCVCVCVCVHRGCQKMYTHFKKGKNGIKIVIIYTDNNDNKRWIQVMFDFCN